MHDRIQELNHLGCVNYTNLRTISCVLSYRRKHNVKLFFNWHFTLNMMYVFQLKAYLL